MTKHKVSELEGDRLDRAVALALCLGGRAMTVAGEVYVSSPIDCEKWIADKHRDGMLRLPMPQRESLALFRPSSDWEIGGPIIEREKIHLEHGGLDGMTTAMEGADAFPSACWFARCGDEEAAHTRPLIAAMRAYVASKFGEEVEL